MKRRRKGERKKYVKEQSDKGANREGEDRIRERKETEC
jgi:hypothetical protein